MTKYVVNKVSQLSAENSVYRLQGISGNAPANCITNIDWQFPEERWVTGAIFAVSAPSWGDRVSVSLVSKVGGVTTTLYTFVEDFCVRSDAQQQAAIEVPYVSLVPAGVYLRISYNNNSLLNLAKIGLNLFTHIPLDSYTG